MPDGLPGPMSVGASLQIGMPGFGISLDILGGIPFHNKDGPWRGSVGCVDWQESQWQASYKGVPFAVARDSKTGGRRIHIHEYPGREHWDNEDLGRLRQQVEVQGYVYGDQCDLWAETLFAMCTDKAMGQLSLPFRPPAIARCLTVESTFDENSMGRIDFSMRFVLEPFAGNPLMHGLMAVLSLSPVALIGAVTSSVGSLFGQARASFETRFTAGPISHVDRNQSANIIKTVAVNLTKSAGQARVTAETASKLNFAASRMRTLADELVHMHRSSPNHRTAGATVMSQRIVPTSQLAAAQAGLRPLGQSGAILRESTQQVIPKTPHPDEGFGGIYSQALVDLAEGAPDPRDLIQSLNALSVATTDQYLGGREPSSAASAAEARRLADTVTSLTRRLALSQQASASVQIAPERMNETIEMRKRIIRQLDKEIERSVDEPETYAALRRVRSNVVKFVAYWSTKGKATDKVPVKNMRPMGALVAKLYPGERAHNRDQQLMRLNGIKHPLFPPTEISMLK